jgi:chromate transporter
MNQAVPRRGMIRQGSASEVFAVFLMLGLSSFGGPIAHLGYFRAELVERRRWLDERSYADLVGLCQFLPGPASSQVGVALGLMRAGWRGGLAAWTGFTLPSAVLLVLFAYGAAPLADSVIGARLLHGFKLAAVAVVAQAVWSMARSLCPDRERASIATIAAIVALSIPAAVGQIAGILLGGLGGLWITRASASKAATPKADIAMPEPLALPVSRSAGAVCLALFLALLTLLPLMHGLGKDVAIFDAFYRSGALVFGGGHVVLPLLHDAVVTPGWISDNAFLDGYGATQAMPGPLFTFAAYLGAVLPGASGGIAGAALALVAIFLPGMLLLVGVLPYWDALRMHHLARAVVRGVNAAVVGLLGDALYDPVWTGAVHLPGDFGLALLGFVLLVVWKAPPLLVVALVAIGTVCLDALVVSPP